MHAHCDPRFRPLLRYFDETALDADAGTVYGVWSDLTLAYCNPAWFRFAEENQGEPNISRDWPLGRSILEAVPPPILPFFQSKYARCLAESCPWQHIYECSSAETYRRFHMKVFPLGNAEGLLFVHSLVDESPGNFPGESPQTERYLHPRGLLIQCCHCRRFRRNEPATAWDWVSAWVKRMPAKVSHGICETCAGFYYGGPRLGAPLPRVITTIEE